MGGKDTSVVNGPRFVDEVTGGGLNVELVAIAVNLFLDVQDLVAG